MSYIRIDKPDSQYSVLGDDGTFIAAILVTDGGRAYISGRTNNFDFSSVEETFDKAIRIAQKQWDDRQYELYKSKKSVKKKKNWG